MKALRPDRFIRIFGGHALLFFWKRIDHSATASDRTWSVFNYYDVRLRCNSFMSRKNLIFL